MHLTDSLKSLQRKVTVMEVSGDVTMAEKFCAIALYGCGYFREFPRTILSVRAKIPVDLAVKVAEELDF